MVTRLGFRGVLLLALAGFASSTASVEVYMYRAQKASSAYAMENVDMADLPGVMKYIHTKAIVEHTQSPDRSARKYDMSEIARYRFLVKNPDEIVNTNQPPMQNVDFSQFINFEYGQGTNPLLLLELAKLGDAVGVQEQTAAADFILPMPYYWFSLSGFCPNLPYTCTNGWTGVGSENNKCESDPPIHTALCQPDSPCPSKGWLAEPRVNETEIEACRNTALDNRSLCPPAMPGQSCLQYTSAVDTFITGGLCNSVGAHPDRIEEPTGKPGCVYSYDKEFAKVSLDALVDFATEECRDAPDSVRPCLDWLDFRKNCTNDQYKHKFDPATKKLVALDNCVEYDIHPDCAADCNSAECMNIVDFEIGLPFWTGRCDAQRNLQRAEALARLFKIPTVDDHGLTMPPIDGHVNGPCDRYDDGGSKACRPNERTLGPFCTREWAGVCSICYIPGGTEEFSDKNAPICPLNVLAMDDYKDLAAISQCKDGSCCTSKDPRDACCLYYDKCGVALADVEAGIDDGSLAPDSQTLALASATGKTDVVTKFIIKYALARTELLFTNESLHNQTEKIKEIAYWMWGDTPLAAASNSLAALYRKINTDLDHPTPAPTPKPSLAPTMPPSAAPAGPGEDGTSDGGESPVVGVILVAVVVLACGGGLYFMNRPGGLGKARQPRTRQAEDSPSYELRQTA